MSVSIGQLLWTQAWSGAPVYLMAIVGQALWLHRAGFRPAGIVAGAMMSAVLTVLLGVILWGRVFAGMGADIMLWDVLNLPAAVAAAVVFPLVTGLIVSGFR